MEGKYPFFLLSSLVSTVQSFPALEMSPLVSISRLQTISLTLLFIKMMHMFMCIKGETKKLRKQVSRNIWRHISVPGGDRLRAVIRFSRTDATTRSEKKG